MKITILEVGEVPDPLQPRFGSYPEMFERMFAATGAGFSFDIVHINKGEPMPDPASVEAVLVPGSAAGVYDDFAWMNPLRSFIRQAYAANTPMVGVCFGHQIIADALGGDVRKSDKGWGLGRQLYQLRHKPAYLRTLGDEIAIAASHQDQVLSPPDEAEIFMASDFAPNAGLIYRNGRTITVQPHPEFDRDYAMALAEQRRGRPLTDEQVARVEKTLEQPLDSLEFAKGLRRFYEQFS